MRTFAVLLASVACVGHGRTVRGKKKPLQDSVGNHQHRFQELRSRREVGDSSAFSALSKVLLGFNSGAGQQAAGARPSCTTTNRLGRHSPVLMRLRSNFEENPLKPPPEPETDKKSGVDISKLPGKFNRGLTRLLIDLRFAVANFFILAILSAYGTILEQDKGTAFYEQNYGSYSVLFPFLPDEIKDRLAILLDSYLPSPGGSAVLLGFDHMYSSPVYVAFGFVLAASLTACSFVRQIPMAKVAQKWSYASSPQSFKSLDESSHLQTPSTTATHVVPRRAASALSKQGYHVFFGGKDDGGAEGYAFKGLSGRFAPIGVHISMILIILGAAYSGSGSWRGDQYISSGESVAVEKVLDRRGPVASGFAAQKQRIRVDDFRIAYYDDGKIDQFYADVALDTPGKPPTPAKTIKVNTPLVGDGLTAYMSDWTVGSVRVLVRPVTPAEGSPESWREFNLPMQPLATDRDILGTFIPFPAGDSAADEAAKDKTLNGAYLVAKDLKQLVVFNADGSFAGARDQAAASQPIVVGPIEILLQEIKGSAGLQLKVDPGVKYVYAGFAGTMATSAASALSHNQVWLSQAGKDLYIGGKTNRLKRDLDEELDEVVAEANAVQTR